MYISNTHARAYMSVSALHLPAESPGGRVVLHLGLLPRVARVLPGHRPPPISIPLPPFIRPLATPAMPPLPPGSLLGMPLILVPLVLDLLFHLLLLGTPIVLVDILLRV